MSLVLFEVGGRRASVAAADVLEVVAVREPTPVPAGPSFLAGLIAHRGAAVPLVDGVECLGAPVEQRTAQTTALLLATSLGPVGLTIDRVLEIAWGDAPADPNVKRVDPEALVRDCRARIAPDGEEPR